MPPINLDDVGWFYHAANKPAPKEEPTPYPPISQISGLRQPEYECDRPISPKPVVFKDSDSDYVRLSKIGGRKDLLNMHPLPDTLEMEKSRPLPTYNRGSIRNDWYYHLDNAVEDEAKKKPMNWKPLLPDYMVHETFQPQEFAVCPEPGRPPFGYDRLSAFQRDDCCPCDKTVKLPELRPLGYGVRRNKPLKSKGSRPKPWCQCGYNISSGRTGDMGVLQTSAHYMPSRTSTEQKRSHCCAHLAYEEKLGKARPWNAATRSTWRPPGKVHQKP